MFDKDEMQAFEEFKDLMVDENEELENVSGGAFDYNRWNEARKQQLGPYITRYIDRGWLICKNCGSPQVQDYNFDAPNRELKNRLYITYTCSSCGGQTTNSLYQIKLQGQKR